MKNEELIELAQELAMSWLKDVDCKVSEIIKQFKKALETGEYNDLTFIRPMIFCRINGKTEASLNTVGISEVVRDAICSLNPEWVVIVETVEYLGKPCIRIQFKSEEDGEFTKQIYDFIELDEESIEFGLIGEEVEYSEPND